MLAPLSISWGGDIVARRVWGVACRLSTFLDPGARLEIEEACCLGISLSYRSR